MDNQSARFRTARSLNLHLVGTADVDEYGMPVIRGTPEVTVDGVTPWTEARTTAEPAQHKAIHFFLDDYRFESLWSVPERYLHRLRAHDYVLSPDFSLYEDMPVPAQVWNVYRSRALANYWQREGINVIPTLQWSTPESYVFALNGLPVNSVLAASTVGVVANTRAAELFKMGCEAAVRALAPSKLLIVGKKIEEIDFGDAEVAWFPPDYEGRFSNGR